MTAVVTVGRSGFEQLVPRQAMASSINNTDINTRLGWYDAALTGSTQSLAAALEKDASGRLRSDWPDAELGVNACASGGRKP